MNNISGPSVSVVLPPPDFKPPNIIEKGSKVMMMMTMMMMMMTMKMIIVLSKVKYNSIGKGGHDWTSKQSQKSKAAATSIIGVKHQYINM